MNGRLLGQSEPLARLLELLDGEQATAAGEGLQSSIAHTWPWPTWAALALLIAAAAVVLFVYAREQVDGSGRARAAKVALAALRLLLVAIVVFMLFGWMRHRYRTDLPDLILAIDDSASMALVDHYEDSKTRGQFASRLNGAGLDELSRSNLAKSLLLERDARLLDALSDRYQLKVYWIGETARPAASSQNRSAEEGASAADDAATLQREIRTHAAEQSASRLGAGLRTILESQRGRPTAAVIVLTDGITTEGRSLGETAEYARRKNVPMYVVALGSDRPPRDVRLADLLANDTAFVGDYVNVDFKLSASGYPGRSIQLRLRREDTGETLAEATETLPQGDAAAPARLSFRADEAGELPLVVDAKPLEGEVDETNNVLRQTIHVRDETIRVLLVQAYPSYEFRYLKTLLERNVSDGGAETGTATAGTTTSEGAAGPASAISRADVSTRQTIELTTVLQEGDREYAELDKSARAVFPVSRDELFAFDVVLFGDVNPSLLSRSIQENLSAFVMERGGGVVFLSGPRFTPLAYRDTPLDELMPIELATASIPDPAALLDRSFAVVPTSLGLTSPAMQLRPDAAANLAVWRELPGIYWMIDAPDLRTGARTLAEHPTRTGSTGRPLPVITVQFIGAGKVVFHATDETYRWARHRGSDAEYARYWIQTIRFLSRSKLLGGSRAVELTADREEYRRGESVLLRARFFDDRLAPEQDDGVAVVLQRAEGIRRQIKLRRDASVRGVFEATSGDLSEGTYRAWIVTPTLEGEPPAAQFTVVAPPGEKARLQTDTADLRRAAEQSQGRFYTFATAGRLLRDLPEGRQVRIESLPPEPIWNSSLLAGLFIILLAAEWLLRKRVGLL